MEILKEFVRKMKQVSDMPVENCTMKDEAPEYTSVVTNLILSDLHPKNPLFSFSVVAVGMGGE